MHVVACLNTVHVPSSVQGISVFPIHTVYNNNMVLLRSIPNTGTHTGG